MASVLTSPPPTTVNPTDPVPAGFEEIDQESWANLGADGIVGDFDGQAWLTTASGANTTVSVGEPGDVVEIRGYRGRLVENQVDVAAAVGVTPAGQSRLNRIVQRLDLATYRVSLAVITGTATAGTPALPPLKRDSAAFDLPCARVRQNGPNAITNALITPERVWKSTTVYLEPGADSDRWPVGTLVVRKDGQFLRVVRDGPTPGSLVADWENLAAPPLVSLPMRALVGGASTPASGSTRLQTHRRGVGPVLLSGTLRLSRAESSGGNLVRINSAHYEGATWYGHAQEDVTNRVVGVVLTSDGHIVCREHLAAGSRLNFAMSWYLTV